MKQNQGKRHPRKSRETRALLGSRFKVLLSDTGLSHDAAAKLLQVTPRTIKYWVSGVVRVPYAAYRLVRIMRGFELPCAGWEGWHMHSGKLWSPEGHGFTPECQGWWHLLVRQAAMFREITDRERHLDIAMQRMTMRPGSWPNPTGGSLSSHEAGSASGPNDAVGRAAKPPGLDLSLKHFRTHNTKNGLVQREAALPCPLSVDTNK